MSSNTPGEEDGKREKSRTNVFNLSNNGDVVFSTSRAVGGATDIDDDDEELGGPITK